MLTYTVWAGEWTLTFGCSDVFIFFSQTTISADFSMVFEQPPMCKLHPSASACTLNIPNTGSPIIVWTHKNTAHTGRNWCVTYSYPWVCYPFLPKGVLPMPTHGCVTHSYPRVCDPCLPMGVLPIPTHGCVTHSYPRVCDPCLPIGVWPIPTIVCSIFTLVLL